MGDIFSAENIRTLLLFAPTLILSLSIHEWAHARAATALGDHTAKFLGRLTLDPMAHISWVGTVIFPAIALLTGAPLFGWAKPVPIDMRNFKNPRTGMALVAAAGPASNLVIATLLVAIFSYLAHSNGLGFTALRNQEGLLGAGAQMLWLGVQLNAFLAFFNLIPLPPLDGSRIVQGLVGPNLANAIDRMESWSGWLILILVISGAFSVIVVPVRSFITLLFAAFQVPMS
jgi:Zn-dependent protease